MNSICLAVCIAVAANSPITFSGKGTTATQMFMLKEGLYIAEVKHSGKNSNVLVWLIDSKGNRVATLANEIGNCNISTAVKVQAGKHLLQVEAPGSWQVSLSQPESE